MKRVTFIFLMITLSLSSFSQNKSNSKVEQIKTYFQKNCVADATKTFFFNRAEKIVELDGYQIPIMKVEIIYMYNDQQVKYKHFVEFSCENDVNCITANDNTKMFGFSIPFSSKAKCYEFINLLSDLRELYE